MRSLALALALAHTKTMAIYGQSQIVPILVESKYLRAGLVAVNANKPMELLPTCMAELPLRILSILCIAVCACSLKRVLVSGLEAVKKYPTFVPKIQR